VITGTISGAIGVTAPTTGVSWVRGRPYAIAWSSTGSPGTHVKIELVNGGNVVGTIAASVLTSAHTHTWHIPVTQALASTYQIEIVSTTIPTIAGISGVFSIT
jgi:hypothetical protein